MGSWEERVSVVDRGSGRNEEKINPIQGMYGFERAPANTRTGVDRHGNKVGAA
jgi:hypothetical protein